MSQANKDIVRKLINALGAGDGETLKSLISKDIQAIMPGTSVLSATRGYDDVVGVGEVFKQITKGGLRFDILSMTAEEDRVSVEVQGHSELINGAAYNNQYHFLFRIRDGKVCVMKEYLDTKLVDQVLAPLFAPPAG